MEDVAVVIIVLKVVVLAYTKTIEQPSSPITPVQKKTRVRIRRAERKIIFLLVPKAHQEIELTKALFWP